MSSLSDLKVGFIGLGILLAISCAHAKEIALTFDDAPFSSSNFFKSDARTRLLVEKLKIFKVPPVIIFANG